MALFLSLLFIFSAHAGRPRIYPTGTQIRDFISRDSFTGVDGYLRFSKLYFFGNMFESFVRTSRVLDPLTFADLKWGHQYHGDIDHYFIEGAQLRPNSRINPIYKNSQGYVRYAERLHYCPKRKAGSMAVAFTNASALLSEAEFLELNWGHCYHGYTVDYLNERQRLYPKGKFDPFFGGQIGYVRYANTFYMGSMKKTMDNVRSALSPDELVRLYWGRMFSGTTEEHQKIRNFLTDQDGQIDKLKWFGKNKGLTKATLLYLELSGLDAEKFKIQVRHKIRAAVTDDELLDLGWDTVNAAPLICYPLLIQK